MLWLLFTWTDTGPTSRLLKGLIVLTPEALHRNMLLVLLPFMLESTCDEPSSWRGSEYYLSLLTSQPHITSIHVTENSWVCERETISISARSGSVADTLPDHAKRFRVFWSSNSDRRDRTMTAVWCCMIRASWETKETWKVFVEQFFTWKSFFHILKYFKVLQGIFLLPLVPFLFLFKSLL